MRAGFSGCVMFIIGLLAIGILLPGPSVARIDPELAVGIWLFDEGQGDVAKDSSGHGLDGKLIGKPQWVDGKFGKALEFDGKSSYVEVPPHENPTDAITVTAWVKSLTPAWNQPGWIVEKRNAFILHPNSGGNLVAFPVCNGGCWNKPGGWSDGAVGPDDITEWHMYTGTFDSSTGDWKIYIDGQEASSLSLNKAKIDLDTGPLHIGWDECCGGNRFGNGIIDEVAVFSVALSEAEIQEIMNNGLYAVALAVGPKGKLATIWATMKAEAE